MRTYSIKRGHHPNLDALVKKYFNVEVDTEKGAEFEAAGIGTVYIKKEGTTLTIETMPSTGTKATVETLRNWNAFLFDATGRTTKERKKQWEKEVKK